MSRLETHRRRPPPPSRSQGHCPTHPTAAASSPHNEAGPPLPNCLCLPHNCTTRARARLNNDHTVKPAQSGHVVKWDKWGAKSHTLSGLPTVLFRQCFFLLCMFTIPVPVHHVTLFHIHHTDLCGFWECRSEHAKREGLLRHRHDDRV